MSSPASRFFVRASTTRSNSLFQEPWMSAIRSSFVSRNGTSIGPDAGQDALPERAPGVIYGYRSERAGRLYCEADDRRARVGAVLKDLIPMSPDDVRRQLERILASPQLSRSERLKRFLRLVVEVSLAEMPPGQASRGEAARG